MSNTYPQSRSARLVESALAKRNKIVKAGIRQTFDSALHQVDHSLWERELDYVNKHITMPPEEVEEAAKMYVELGRTLIRELKWDPSQIEVHPQGSALTRTLIRAPNNSKFDIDAVCAVNITSVAARDPMAFFQEIGDALEDWKPKIKRRCWRIEFNNKPFYIEFTPSIPLRILPTAVQAMLNESVDKRYEETALAVVDTPSRRWKSSNPAGLAKWVNEQANRQLLRHSMLEKSSMRFDSAVKPVDPQEVDLSDTLRVAIRLFKRHRDINVHRGLLQKEFAPISVVIVTLLCRCYKGLSEKGRQYDHPVELLVDLADLMSDMLESENGEYWVANPTVQGENFAERWNYDNGKRKACFDQWCSLLLSDLNSILVEHDEVRIRTRVREVFGCTGAPSPGFPPSGGLAPQKPTKPYPAPVTGLARS